MGLGMGNCDNKLVNDHLDYVRNNALKYVGYGVSYDDLVQVSYITLIRAANNYKYTRNFKEYLNIYLHHYLIEEIIKVNCIHCTGTSYYIDIFKILKARKLGCVSYEEIQDFTSLSIDRIIECSHYIKKDISLSDVELIDVDYLEDDIIDDFDNRRVINKFFNSSFVTDKEKMVIKMRYGFFGKLYKIREISEILGISHQRVSTIEKKVLYKFRKFLLIAGISQYEDFSINEGQIRKLKNELREYSV